MQDSQLNHGQENYDKREEVEVQAREESLVAPVDEGPQVAEGKLHAPAGVGFGGLSTLLQSQLADALLDLK